ncbi:hypothetical protein AC579_402 [Pseudocercospora musae]|uniref:Uncharacterized protein n=1 Tax=Pseudocercospora musae TaxID=113226 RepID=A0A139H664_9PEZI|nr:hypothetical protein AC579_402 [Pseudocercospora musae]
MPPRKRKRQNFESESAIKRPRTSPPPNLHPSSTRITRSSLRRLASAPQAQAQAQAQHRVALWASTLEMSAPSDTYTSYPRSKRSRNSAHSTASLHAAATASASASATATSIDTEVSIKTIHDSRVPLILAENNIYESMPDNKPDNYDDIMRRMAQPRPSLSPSRCLDSVYQEYLAAHDTSTNESAIAEKVVAPFFAPASKYTSGRNTTFSELKPITATPIPKPKPDLFIGEHRGTLHPDALKACRDTVVPTKAVHNPVLVNHTLEAKGPYGTGACARTQVTYNGAVGARAMESLQSYATPDVPYPDGRAQTFGASYTDGSMSFYSTHSRSAPWGGGRAYHTYRLAAVATVNSPDDLRKGMTYWRNQMEMAAEERVNLVDRANARALTSADTIHFPTPSASTSFDRTSREPGLRRGQAKTPPRPDQRGARQPQSRPHQGDDVDTGSDVDLATDLRAQSKDSSR